MLPACSFLGGNVYYILSLKLNRKSEKIESIPFETNKVILIQGLKL